MRISSVIIVSTVDPENGNIKFLSREKDKFFPIHLDWEDGEEIKQPDVKEWLGNLLNTLPSWLDITLKDVKLENSHLKIYYTSTLPLFFDWGEYHWVHATLVPAKIKNLIL